MVQAARHRASGDAPRSGPVQSPTSIAEPQLTGARHSLRSRGGRGRLRQVAVDDESLDPGRFVRSRSNRVGRAPSASLAPAVAARPQCVGSVCVTSSAFVFRAPRFCGRDVCMAVHGAAAPAHQYASRFLRAARPIARPGAGEHARAARGPVAPRAQWPFR